MNELDEYEAELTADSDEIAAILSDVADGIRSGSVRLGTGADALTVDTPEELELEIELETEDDVTSLELELEWPAASDASPDSPVEDDASEGDDDSSGRKVEERGDGMVDAVAEDVEDEPTIAGAADGSRSLARFEVYQGTDDEWRWRLRHRNGNIVATGGEGYTRKHNALKGLRSVMANSTDAAITDASSN